MINEIFGKWTVISMVRQENHASKVCLCRCICGTERLIRPHALKSGRTRGCSKCNFTHKKSHTNVYRIWSGMLSRCNNPKVKIYHRYGGRGIKVSDDWKSFENFFRDMGDRPISMELDRINNNSDYSKENCRWVTRKQNVNNRSLIDNMPGKKFGKWLVRQRVDIENQTHWYYECICDCGYQTIISGGELRRGRTTQCKSCKNIAHIGWRERYDNARK